MSDTLMEASAPFGAAPDSLFLEVLQRFRSTNPTFLIGDDVVRRYHLAMQTRGFVILSGSSGTGKTWLAQAYAEAVGARAKLVAAADPEFLVPWTLKHGDQEFFTMPRISVLRTFVMNHMVHHRGQLTVYLRLNNVPVPAIYGPTADEPQGG